jgi:hypothetical protein
LKTSAWWKNNQESVRNWDILKKTDPAQAASKLLTMRQAMQAAGTQMGVDLDDAALDKLAEDANRFGWQELQIKGALAGHAVYKEDFGGDIGAFETTVKKTARDFLTPIDDRAAFDWAKKWAGGEIDDQNVTEFFRTQAKGLLPTLADQIDQGLTPRQLLSSQITTAAQLLEVDPENVDLLKDQRFNPIISHAGEDGKLRVMTLAETQKHIKGLDDYWKTKNASNEVSSLVSGLTRTFGKIA